MYYLSADLETKQYALKMKSSPELVKLFKEKTTPAEGEIQTSFNEIRVPKTLYNEACKLTETDTENDDKSFCIWKSEGPREVMLVGYVRLE